MNGKIKTRNNEIQSQIDGRAGEGDVDGAKTREKQSRADRHEVGEVDQDCRFKFWAGGGVGGLGSERRYGG